MFQIFVDVEAIGFPVQNAYKMMYTDENATFEPLNLEPVNGYLCFLFGQNNHKTMDIRGGVVLGKLQSLTR